MLSCVVRVSSGCWRCCCCCGCCLWLTPVSLSLSLSFYLSLNEPPRLFFADQPTSKILCVSFLTCGPVLPPSNPFNFPPTLCEIPSSFPLDVVFDGWIFSWLAATSNSTTPKFGCMTIMMMIMIVMMMMMVSSSKRTYRYQYRVRTV